MRIAILRKKYTFHGGAEGFSQSFINMLTRAGHEVHLFSIKWEGPQQTEKLFFHHVPSITVNSFLRDLTFAISSLFIMKKEGKDFDIIQSHDKTLYQDIYRAGDGCHIEWLRQRWRRTGFTGRLSIMFNPYHWLILLLERRILKGHKFKKIIAISEMVKKNIIDNYKTPASDIKVIYNGIDTDKFHPDNRNKYRKEIRQKYGLKDTEFIVLFVGSGFERKGVKFLIEAVESIHEPVTLLIVGKGPEKSFSKMIKKQKIIFCGPQQEINRFYAAADIFVFPTIYEPFGNVHLEALASGLPVVTTRQSGASEIIEEGKQGFIMERPEDTAMLAEKITQLMDKDLNRRMGADARRLSERFSFENHINEMLELYSSIKETK